jgi:hypothetical protein
MKMKAKIFLDKHQRGKICTYKNEQLHELKEPFTVNHGIYEGKKGRRKICKGLKDKKQSRNKYPVKIFLKNEDLKKIIINNCIFQESFKEIFQG